VVEIRTQTVPKQPSLRHHRTHIHGTKTASEIDMCLDLRSGTHYLELTANPFSGSI
jgi:hypothetical protein